MGKSKAISRRSFIRNVGTGLAGAAVMLTPVRVLSQAEREAGKAVIGTERMTLEVNGRDVSVKVHPWTTLADLLRDHLYLTGTKVSCNHGECGCCTVLLNNRAVYSCQMLALDASNQRVTTIEGLLNGEELHPVQKAFVEHDGLQCGFCTPGQVMAAQSILLEYDEPTPEQVRDGMAGNLCRCAAYPNILASAVAAADKKE